MNNKEKNIIIVILLLIVFALSSLCIYHMFIKDDEKTEEKEEENNEVETINTFVEKVVLDSSNKEISVGSKKLNLKVVDSTLYIDNQKNDVNLADTIYVSNQYVLLTVAGQFGDALISAINEKGEIIKVYNNIASHEDVSTVEVNNVRVENNQVVADFTAPCFENCSDDPIKVSITYSNDSIIIKNI